MNNALAIVDNVAGPLEIAAPLSFTVPISDGLEFARLAEKRRTEVTVFLQLLRRVHELAGTHSLHAACQTVAAASQHLMRGCSRSTLRSKYKAYMEAKGDWRSLVLGYKGPVAAQPAAFVAYVQKLAEENQRSMVKAFDLIRQMWREGHPIPGYGTWAEYYMTRFPERTLPKHCPSGWYPQGWSDRTLYRRAPAKGVRLLYQRGFAAAKRYFPSVTRDPSQLRPLELIVIDDFELDCLCVFPGDSQHKPQIGRVAGLLAIDVATRKKLHWGIGQRLERVEEQGDGTVKTVRTGISRLDVQALLFCLFEKYGLPEYPITILCENAAASISADLELALLALFNGRVRVKRTGMIDRHNLTNGFCESGGRPWDKGWIESMFNALWNQLGAMPGYKGNNARLNAPADLDAKIKYTKLFIGQGEKAFNLPPEQIALLRLPFPSPEAVEQAFAWACACLDQQTKHKYLGFDTVTEFLLAEGTDPVPFSALAHLSPDQQALAQPLERKESPLERWSRLSAANARTAIDKNVLSLLMLNPKKGIYRNAAVSFVHAKQGYSYVDPEGKVLANVAEGTELLVFLNVNAPEEAPIATLKGDYIGNLIRLGGRKGMVDIRDREAIAAAGAIQAKIVNRAVAGIRERHAEEDAQLAQDRAHNDAIVEAHKAATKNLSKAERIGLAAGEIAEERQRQQETAKALAKAEGLDITQIS